MRKLLLIVLMLLANQLFSQELFMSRYRVVLDTVNIEKYTIDTVNSNEYLIAKFPLKYGQIEVNESDLFKTLDNAKIAKVDFVYTEYPTDLDLYYLNYQRLNYLHYKCDGIFSNPLTKWKLYKQTGCKSREEANEYFHGFIVYYKPGASRVAADEDLEKLRSTINNKETLSDSTLLKILNRLDFKDAPVVSDFTGSMAPYITQLLVWYNLNNCTRKTTQFTFFNDGDTKPDYKKIKGKTGGIYSIETDNKDSVLAKAVECTINGFGGDIEENNIEAILSTIKNYPKIKEVILIADNWSPVRDMTLLSAVKIPIHVLVCGKDNESPLNLDLVNIALLTKGSIHTIEEDLSFLIAMNEGETFKIGNEFFRIQSGTVVRVKK